MFLLLWKYVHYYFNIDCRLLNILILIITGLWSRSCCCDGPFTTLLRDAERLISHPAIYKYSPQFNTSYVLKNTNIYTDEKCSRRKVTVTDKNTLTINFNHILQAILEFLKFLYDWESIETKVPVSKSTMVGLKMTLQATLEILDMLSRKCNYHYYIYLMTATLSQDPLEVITLKNKVVLINSFYLIFL